MTDAPEYRICPPVALGGPLRNPLHVGLIVLDIALALMWPSAWALILVPAGIGLLSWGAMGPEERDLGMKFGDAYAGYRRRVRRWL